MLPGQANAHDEMQALSLVAREQLARRWVATQAADTQSKSKRVYYLSMEFLMGRSLSNALDALNLTGPAADALQAHARTLEDTTGPRARRGTGQRRPGSPGGLLSGFHGHAGSAIVWLRPAL